MLVQYASDMEKRINELENAVKEMSECVEFYGDKKSWEGFYGTFDQIDSSDKEQISPPWANMVGGKKARRCLEKHRELIEGINKE